MLNNKGFDEWAGTYDESVNRLSKEYPFDGYYDILHKIYDLIENKSNSTILDVGFGTGFLTNKLYEAKSKIYGLDFSKGMIDIAQKKMPHAKFIKCDLNLGLPDEIKNVKFDYIISSYAIHHFTDDKKIDLIYDFTKHLNKNGKIIIADVAFETREDMAKCKEKSLDDWDNDEIYITYDTFKNLLLEKGLKSKYNQISSCGGILSVASYELWVTSQGLSVIKLLV